MIAMISKKKPKDRKSSGFTKDQRLAITCAYCDLKGAFENKFEDSLHDWEAHQKTIETLEKVFPFVIK